MVNTKASRIEIRANEEAKNLIEKAASITGKTISAYMLNNALASAKKDIEQMESISLGNKDRDMFYSLISNPPAPNEALKKLFNSDSTQ
ncbi:DUF1778 domain-containing protein [Spirochaeta isovalerica]|uniref:Uncharacterized protein (DUF1778 family) n=1 Tax=Spirochaeta isovalerica TaxID=150 RepID=A0A841RBY4_9SPIO|nr:DUF1778 domain-containing protein [Spirochaeta isovalerica]MBB6480881.1 uncharacterized protein (DUF1778 family) [Spirochaeta isovalerica]